MLMKLLVAGVIAVLPFVSGCSTFKPDYWYSYGWIADQVWFLIFIQAQTYGRIGIIKFKS